jgi:hypothetical protein
MMGSQSCCPDEDEAPRCDAVRRNDLWMVTAARVTDSGWSWSAGALLLEDGGNEGRARREYGLFIAVPLLSYFLNKER